MKPHLIKDIPFGVLLLVLSFYCIWGVMYLAGYPSDLRLAGIMIMAYLAPKLISLGVGLMVGIEVNKDK